MPDTEGEDLSATAARSTARELMHQATPTTTGAATRRPFGLRAQVALAALLAVLAGLVGQGVPGAAAAPSTADALTRVVVQARADLGAVAGAIAEHGGQVVEVLAPFRMVVAEVPTGAVGAVEAEAATGAVSPDVPLRVQSMTDEEVADAFEKDTSRQTVNAPGGDAGKDVGVVVVDTGIAENPALDVRARYNLAPGRDADAHGHGTFMAGLIAADGTHGGVAPGAHLVSVRVADATGATTLTRVLSGLAVADAARDVHDAPVVLLALSGPTADVPDPIMIVSEMLWARGSTVVVASGNARGDDHQVGSPGADPYLLTVGATDDPQDDGDASNDIVAPFSAYGAASFAPDRERPDLVAPGAGVIGLRTPGSLIDGHDQARVGDDHFRGSGTSMAAALTAGAAAAVLAAHPDLTPNEVKGRLVTTATERADTNPGWGAGTLDVAAAIALTPAEDAGEPNGNAGLAPLPTPKRGGPPAAKVLAPGKHKQMASDHAPAGWSWAGWSWAGWSWAGWSWAEWQWEGWSWAAGETEWAGWSWADGEWAGWSWAGWSWAGWSWAGWSWADGEWAGWSWADDGWAGWSWAGWSWSAAGWGDTWEDDATA